MCKLAIELHMSLVEVRNLPAEEIRRWQEYFSKHMFTNDVMQYQLAEIAYLFYVANSGKEAKITDFIPSYQTPKDNPETVIQKLEILRSIFGQKG